MRDKRACTRRRLLIMGGFIASNSPIMLEKASQIFTEQDMLSTDVIVDENLVVRYFSKIGQSKIVVTKIKNIYACVTGSFQYNGLISQKALDAIIQDYLSGTLDYANIRGSWNLILANSANSAMVVSSPSGQYFSFYHESGKEYLISSSFLACGVTLKSKIELNPLQALDYICNNATHSDDSFLKGISQLPAGCVCELSMSKMNISLYAKGQTELKSYSAYTNLLIENWSDAFKSMSENGGLKIDISGGLDSRLIAALVKNCGVPHSYNVNYSSNAASQDVVLAKFIAKKEDKELQIIEYPAIHNRIEWKDLKSSFVAYDGLRSVLGKANVAHHMFKQKALNCEYLIGGHGGELLREYWYSMPIKPHLSNFLKRHYTIPGMSFLNKDLVQYHNRLASRILGGIQYLESADFARLYYQSRMRFWAGARISVLNKYVSKFSPLNDFHQSEIAIAIDPKFKRYAMAEKQVIKSLSPTMFSYPSQYGTLKLTPSTGEKLARAKMVFTEAIKLHSDFVTKASIPLEDLYSLGPHDLDLRDATNEVIAQCQIINVINTRQVASNIMSLALILTVLRDPGKYLFKTDIN